MSLEDAINRLAAAIENNSPVANTGATAKPVAVPQATQKLPGSTPSKPPVTKAPAAATKPPKTAPTPEPETPAISLAQISEDISALLQANLKPSTIDLLAEFGAKSASGVKEDDFASFHEKALALLELNA